MSTWEERMAAKAKARSAVREAEDIARQAVEDAERARLEEEACRPNFEAGPPCAECYEWRKNWARNALFVHAADGWSGEASPAWAWMHRQIEDGDHYCRHECHQEPLWCGLIALA